MALETRLGKWMFFGVIAAITLGFLGAVVTPWMQADRDQTRQEYSDQEIGDKIHPVVIQKNRRDALVDTGKKDAHGKAVMVSCATCHDTRKPDTGTHLATSLDEFHQGMKYQHGGQTCLTCHNPGDYNSLKRADGSALEFSESIQLCAQCHGPQFRDYQNGSHGGMTGYWNLKQGPRERNHCTNCHDPHSPQYPLVMPVFPPKPVIGEATKLNQKNPHH